MSKPRMIGLRLYLCASGALSASALLVGGARLLGSEDSTGTMTAAFLLLTVCLVGALDTLINDVSGARWTLQWAESWRHDGYVLLAITNLALIFVAANKGLAGDNLLRYGLDAVMAAYVAFRDIQLRFIEPRKESQSHADHHA